MTTTSNTPRILRIKDVTQTTGLSRSSIYRLIELGIFPRQIVIGIKAVGWNQNSVANYLVERELDSMNIH